MDTDTPEHPFYPIPKQPPFYVTPEDIAWRMRDTWIGEIRRGYPSVQNVILRHLEQEAVFRFRREGLTSDLPARPASADQYDDWLQEWWNEARHNCSSGQAGDHLSPIGQAAVNVIMTCAALREAIGQGNAELSAALAMQVLADVLAGGYSLEFEATKQAKEAIDSAKRAAYQKGAGREAKDLNTLRTACIDGAKKIWEKTPSRRIGDVAKHLLFLAESRRDRLPSLEKLPSENTVKKWLKEAAANGKLTIPSGAQARGRPSKAKK